VDKRVSYIFFSKNMSSLINSLFVILIINSIAKINSQTLGPFEPCYFIGCICEYKCYNMQNDCSFLDFEAYISCDGNGSTQFPKRLYISQAHKVANLTIRNFSFKKIPDYSFNMMRIKYLFLLNNSIETLTTNAFRTFPNSSTFLGDGFNAIFNIVIKDQTLKYIESNALYKNFLNSLDFSDCGLTSSRLEVLFVNKFDLGSIYIFKLERNEISYLKNEWFGFPNIEEIHLKSNMITELPEYIFSRPNLRFIDLSYNSINDISKIVNRKSLSYQLKSINLAGNFIKSLEKLPIYQTYFSLTDIDLSENMLQSFTENDFRRLNGLSSDIRSLSLANNKISYIYENINFTNLMDLNLKGNFLSDTPKLVNLKLLARLDISSQRNDSLKTVKNYAFERKISGIDFTIRFHIDLDSNKIRSFDNKAFCSRYSMDPLVITSLKLTFNSMKNMNKCLLTQIKNSDWNPKRIQIIVNEPSLTDIASGASYGDICNCDFVLFADKLGIEIRGVCAEFNISRCPITIVTQLEVDNCLLNKDFRCDESNYTFQSSFFSTSSLGLTNSVYSHAKKTRPIHSFVLIGFVFFLFLLATI